MLQDAIPLEVDMLYGKGWCALWEAVRCEVKMKGGRKAVRGCGQTGVPRSCVSGELYFTTFGD